MTCTCIRSLAILVAAAMSASAHLDSLITPKPGIGYSAGASMIIRWTIGNNHNGIDVHLSTDDKTWKTLVADLAKTQTAWSWNVPANLLADRARIRVCQKSGPQGCTDGDSVSNPSDGPLYTLVSGRFRIESAPTGLALPGLGFPGPANKAPTLFLDRGVLVLMPSGIHGSRGLDLRGRALPQGFAH